MTCVLMLSVKSLVGLSPSRRSHTRASCHKDTPRISCDKRGTRLPHGVRSSLPLQVRLRAPPSHRATGGPQAPSPGVCTPGLPGAAFTECPGNFKLQDSLQPQRGHGPGRARPPPASHHRGAMGSQEPVSELGSPSPPAGPQGRPGERPRPQRQELPRPSSEDVTVICQLPETGEPSLCCAPLSRTGGHTSVSPAASLIPP